MSEAPTGSNRLLVVDDNEMNRELLARRLQQRGYGVETAADGYLALQAVESGSFDLVLLDVMMPGLSGIDVVRTLRESWSAAELPVIMATARDGSEDIVQAFEAGANDYVTKPIDFPVILARIRTQLDLRSSQQLLRRANDRLEDASRRIARLEAAAARSLDDPAAWGASVASDLAAAAGVGEAGVFELRGEDVEPLAPTSIPAPPLRELRRAAAARGPVPLGGATLVPLVSPTGQLHGGLVVPRETATLDEATLALLASFAHHLASAFELARLRRELDGARIRREAVRREFLDAGVDLVQLCPACGLCYDQRTSRCAQEGRLLETPRVLPYRLGGRYRLVRSLGEGGMGSIFEGHDERLGRDVALKVLKPEHFGEPAVRRRFEQEARALGQIAHSGVVTVHDFGDLEDGSVFLVMEMLRGRDLELLLRFFGPGTPRQVAEVVRQGGEALSAAHRAGVLHRDVKPGNVFLCDATEVFRVKMLDFGLAKSLTKASGVTQAGLIVGTPAYMSPEQIQEKELDERSDLYSLAAVAWETLTGRRLIRSTEIFDIFSEIVRTEAPPVSSQVLGIPPRVDAVFSRALEKNRDLRPRQVTEWSEEAASLLAELPGRNAGWPELLESALPYGAFHERTETNRTLPDPEVAKKTGC